MARAQAYQQAATERCRHGTLFPTNCSPTIVPSLHPAQKIFLLPQAFVAVKKMRCVECREGVMVGEEFQKVVSTDTKKGQGTTAVVAWN